jgi:hypothetical protein
MNVRRAIAGATRSSSNTYPPRFLRGFTSNVATRACFKPTIFLPAECYALVIVE